MGGAALTFCLLRLLLLAKGSFALACQFACSVKHGKEPLARFAINTSRNGERFQRGSGGRLPGFACLLDLKLSRPLGLVKVMMGHLQFLQKRLEEGALCWVDVRLGFQVGEALIAVPDATPLFRTIELIFWPYDFRHQGPIGGVFFDRVPQELVIFIGPL